MMSASFSGPVRGAATCLLSILLCPYPTVRGADPTHAARAVRQSLSMIEKGDYETAKSELTKALKVAESENHTYWLPRLRFYRGLAAHRQATDTDPSATEPQTVRLLKAAREDYAAAKELDNEAASAACLANLAQVQALLDNESAEENFRAAINLEGNNQLAHILNYADFLYDRNRFDEAMRIYEAAITKDPNSQRGNKGLAACLKQKSASDFGGHLWKLVSRGNTRQALALSLDAIQDPGWREADYEEFITCVARCLSQQYILTAEQLPSELREIESHSVVGQGAKEIRLLFAAESLDNRRFPWWSNRAPKTPQSIETRRGGWPQEAFVVLINSRGDYFRRTGDFQRAEEHYRFAYDLTPTHVSSDALIRLADMWFGREQTAKLRDFLREEETRLFHQKSRAIEQLAAKRMYEMHRALAKIYANLEMWDGDGYKNARFQSEHALASLKAYNRKLASGDPNMIVDTELVNSLSTHYREHGDPAKAYKLRVESAINLKDVGAWSAAADVINPLNSENTPIGVSNDLKIQVSRLNEQLKNAEPDLGLKSSFDHDLTARPNQFREIASSRNVTIWHDRTSPIDRKDASKWTADIERMLSKTAQSKTSEPQVGLLPEGVSKDVLDMRFDGRQGQITARRDDGNAVTVPFRVRGNTKRRSPAFQFAR